ncbi:integrin alpha-3 [Bombina bombina]|uniref:integrin alpha-3 n=1 Tax=Bombina bombina TaxID=8345 RepID=UPI00235AE363|nr:integrin alpha-3 [Bombina bombina]
MVMLVPLLLIGLCRSSSGFNVDTQFPVLKEAGVPGGLFGFSVSLHQQLEGEKRYLLLSGAPQDVAPPGVNANRTGALYACPITTSTSDCFRVPIDQKSDPKSNILENMWMGVTVQSQGPGERVLVCAHRYTAVQWSGNEDQRRMIGKCYVRGNDLDFNDSDDWQTYHNEQCNSNTDHEGTGMCQLGMSGGFTKNMLYFGAPGAYDWQGTNYVLQRQSNWDLTEISYANVKERNIYIGYTMQIGTGILQKDQETVVSGAPRWEHKGAVYLLELQGNSMALRQVISGKQVGSYFGCSIALADLNNDGWQDIIVGAPYYFDRKEEVGGAVYVFTNEAGHFSNESSLILRGPSRSGFGFALANIGDINQDGFTDLAVGAPFEGPGKVYIYHSNAQGLQPEPRQVINGSQVGSISTFGYSLSGGLDVDDNSYPDLLVGSLNDRIALLRSRPVINISKTFSVSPSLVDPSKCNKTSCMEVKLCFSYTLSTGNPNYKKNITLQYTLEGDKDRRPVRVHFFNSSGSVYKGFFSMPDTTCQTMQLLLLENIRDKLHPIRLYLNYSILERDAKGRGSVRSLDNYPVLSQYQNNYQELEIHFQKECGLDNVCRSNLKMQYEYTWDNQEPLPRVDNLQVLQYNRDVNKLHLRITVTNSQGDDAHEARLNITVPPELVISATRPPGVCTLEEPILCDLGNPFKKNQKAEIVILFEISGISLWTREVKTGLQLSTLSFQTDLDQQSAVLLVDYTVQTDFSVAPKEFQTYFSGEVMGESAMKTVQDMGSPVQFTFLVQNQGEPLKSAGKLVFVVDWPYEVTNGKWLIYPTEVKVKTDKERSCEPPGDIIDPLNITLINARRKKREIENLQFPQDVQSLASTKRDHSEVTLTCGGGANCLRFSCTLDDVEKSATVIVRGRVWNSTFLEDYRHLDRVTVKAAAELYLQTDIPSVNMKNHSVQFSVVIDSELEEPPPVELPLKVIIISVISGILLLGVIIVLMWKCGFFKRASTRAMYEVRGQKAEMKVQPSETERLTKEN